jgi:hypothetical protein
VVEYTPGGERTLHSFSGCVQPFAIEFMALFERSHFPHRSMLWSQPRSNCCENSFSKRPGLTTCRESDLVGNEIGKGRGAPGSEHE